jgi:tetratricopeptide (TPR) repeat protein
VLAARAGEVDRGRALIGEALALFEESNDAPGQIGMRLALGYLAADTGELERARDLLEECRERADRQLHPRASGWVTITLAELAIAAGETERAAQLLDEALERLRPLGEAWGVARCLELDQAAAKRSLSPAGEG